MTNKKRAEMAHRATVSYRPDDPEEESVIRDLVCNLRHLADRRGLDWDEQMRMAMNNYAVEIELEENAGERLAKNVADACAELASFVNTLDQLARTDGAREEEVQAATEGINARVAYIKNLALDHGY